MSEALTPETACVEVVMSLADLRALLGMVETVGKRASAGTLHAIGCAAARVESPPAPEDLSAVRGGVVPLAFLQKAEAVATSKLYEANSRG